jgi:hypothetical protein
MNDSEESVSRRSADRTLPRDGTTDRRGPEKPESFSREISTNAPAFAAMSPGAIGPSPNDGEKRRVSRPPEPGNHGSTRPAAFCAPPCSPDIEDAGAKDLR